MSAPPGRAGTLRAAAAAVLAALAAPALPADGAAEAQEWLEMTTARQVSGEDSLDVTVQYGAGRLQIGPAEQGLLYRARLRYDAGAFRPLRSYELEQGVASVRLGLRSEDGDGVQLDWDDLDLGSLDLDEMDLGAGSHGGTLDVGLARGVPTSLEVITGAARATLELGGLPLTRLRLASGASETEVAFAEPNPVPMERLTIKAGAASLDLEGLGNAGAREIRVENAVGEVDLDFTGRWTRDARATVKTGLGAVTLRIPSDVAVRLTKSGLLSSFSGLGLEKAEDGSYRSANWDEAEHRLHLEVDAAFGSVDVVRVE